MCVGLPSDPFKDCRLTGGKLLCCRCLGCGAPQPYQDILIVVLQRCRAYGAKERLTSVGIYCTLSKDVQSASCELVIASRCN